MPQVNHQILYHLKFSASVTSLSSYKYSVMAQFQMKTLSIYNLYKHWRDN